MCVYFSFHIPVVGQRFEFDAMAEEAVRNEQDMLCDKWKQSRVELNWSKWESQRGEGERASILKKGEIISYEIRNRLSESLLFINLIWFQWNETWNKLFRCLFCSHQFNRSFGICIRFLFEISSHFQFVCVCIVQIHWNIVNEGLLSDGWMVRLGMLRLCRWRTVWHHIIALLRQFPIFNDVWCGVCTNVKCKHTLAVRMLNLPSNLCSESLMTWEKRLLLIFRFEFFVGRTGKCKFSGRKLSENCVCDVKFKWLSLDGLLWDWCGPTSMRKCCCNLHYFSG